MSEFVFLPPPSGAPKDSAPPDTGDANTRQLTSDAASEPFVFLAPPKNDATASSPDRTGHDLTGAAGALGGAYASRKFDPKSPANIESRNASMGMQVAPMEYERSGLQRYLNSQISPNLKMSLADLERVLGGEKIRTPSDVQNALKAIQEVKTERTAKTASVDQTTGKPRRIYTMEAGRPAVDLSEFERKPGFINRAADELSDLAGMAKGKLGSVGKVGLGGLGGALAGSQIYDAVDQYKKEGPSLRNAAQFASGVGGALGAVPTGVTQAAGLALQVPELGYQAVDYAKELEKRRQQATREDVEKMLTNVDMMGNPIP